MLVITMGPDRAVECVRILCCRQRDATAMASRAALSSLLRHDLRRNSWSMTLTSETTTAVHLNVATTCVPPPPPKQAFRAATWRPAAAKGPAQRARACVCMRVHARACACACAALLYGHAGVAMAHRGMRPPPEIFRALFTRVRLCFLVCAVRATCRDSNHGGGRPCTSSKRTGTQMAAARSCT